MRNKGYSKDGVLTNLIIKGQVDAGIGGFYG